MNDSPNNVTNGTSSHVASKPATYVDYPARMTTSLEPGASGGIPYRVRRAATIVDVIAPPHVEIVAAAFGRRRIDLRKVNDGTISDVLKADPCEAIAGTTCVLTVRNKSVSPERVEVFLRVTNEHGPEADGQSPFRMSGDASTIGISGSKPGSSRVRTPTPRRAEREEVSPPPVESVRRKARPPPGASEKERARDRALRMRARTPDVITVAPIVQPPPTSKVFTLFRAYAKMLESFFAFRAPIQNQHRPAISMALAKAHRRAVGTSASLRSNEIAIILSEADVARLDKAIRLHREYQLANPDVFRDAIKKALAGISHNAANPPSADARSHNAANPTSSDARSDKPAQSLAVSSLVPSTPPDVTSEGHGESIDEVEAMLASDLTNTSTPVDGRPE